MKFLLLFFVLFTQNVFAEEFIVNIQKKQADKYENRWTLTDWFEDKRKMRLQDMWLAGNVREDNYEFFIGGSSASATSFKVGAADSPSDITTIDLAGYATIAGLEVKSFDEVDNNTTGWEAQFKLRLLGTSLQNTNIVLGYGVRNTKNSTDEYQNNIFKGLMTLYFTKNFGISGEYTKIYPAESGINTLNGEEVESQLFIDFNLLRIYGASVTGFRTINNGTSDTKTEISGFKMGLKFFL